MKKIFLLACSLCFSFILPAQEEKQAYIHKGLIRSMATFSPGYMFGPEASTLSVHGCLEYYVADRISVRGSSFYTLDAKASGYDLLDLNFCTFSGAAWHLPVKSNFDPYFSFEPGVAVVRESLLSVYPGLGEISVNPVYSGCAGFNYYFQRWFHLFAETRYIYGKHIADHVDPLSLSEIRFSFGLGFNLPLIKRK